MHDHHDHGGGFGGGLGHNGHRAPVQWQTPHWNVDASVDENINRAQRNNVFGKASRSRVEDILAIFRQRYLTENSVTQALVTLVRKRFPTAALERLLYFHSARADQLLRDAVTEILVPMRARGLVDINVQEFQRLPEA